ncbi:MAG: hypothetical protein ACP5T9_05325 [Thermoplasmata archaeon]
MENQNSQKKTIAITISLSNSENEEIIKALKQANKVYTIPKQLIMEAVEKCADKVSPIAFSKTDISYTIKFPESYLLSLKNLCYEKGFIDGFLPAYSKFLRACLLHYVRELNQQEMEPSPFQSTLPTVAEPSGVVKESKDGNYSKPDQ